jgi:hypothetical protein
LGFLTVIIAAYESRLQRYTDLLVAMHLVVFKMVFYLARAQYWPNFHMKLVQHFHSSGGSLNRYFKSEVPTTHSVKGFLTQDDV